MKKEISETEQFIQKVAKNMEEEIGNKPYSQYATIKIVENMNNLREQVKTTTDKLKP